MSKPTPKPKPSKEDTKIVEFPTKQFAFKVTAEESAAFHAAAGPGKGSKVARGLVQLFIKGTITFEIVKGEVVFHVVKK